MGSCHQIEWRATPNKIATGASRQRAACLVGPSLPQRRPRTRVSPASSRIDGDALVFLFDPIAPAGNYAVKFGLGNCSHFARAVGKVFVDAGCFKGRQIRHVAFGPAYSWATKPRCPRVKSDAAALRRHEFAKAAFGANANFGCVGGSAPIRGMRPLGQHDKKVIGRNGGRAGSARTPPYCLFGRLTWLIT
jgi:hypothetical protein